MQSNFVEILFNLILETVFQSVHDALPFAGTIVCLDSIAILLHRHAFAIGNILFAVGILFVTSYLKTNPRKTTLEVPIEVSSYWHTTFQ